MPQCLMSCIDLMLIVYQQISPQYIIDTIEGTINLNTFLYMLIHVHIPHFFIN